MEAGMEAAAKCVRPRERAAYGLNDNQFLHLTEIVESLNKTPAARLFGK